MNIVDLSNIVYHPYNRDNLDVSGLNWYIISFDNLTNKGTYILEYNLVKLQDINILVLRSFNTRRRIN